MSALNNISDKIAQVFATPLLVHDWEEMNSLNSDLQTLVLAQRQSDGGETKSNVGGWHSGLEFLNAPDPPIVEVRRKIRDLFSATLPHIVQRPSNTGARLQIAIEGWANVLEAGDYNTLHSHPNAAWSGVYFVTGTPGSVESDAFAGRLEFVDPRPAASLTYAGNMSADGRIMTYAKPGRMVIFPAWLQHFVHPFRGEGLRISIAFNIFLREG